MGAEKVKLKLKFQVLNLAKHMGAEKNRIQIKFQPQLFKSGHAVSFFLHNSLQSVTPLSEGYVKVQPLDIAASVFSRKFSTPNLGNLPPTFLCKICHPLFWGSLPPSIWDIDQPDKDDLKLDPLVQLLRDGVGFFHRWHHIDQVLLQTKSTKSSSNQTWLKTKNTSIKSSCKQNQSSLPATKKEEKTKKNID